MATFTFDNNGIDVSVKPTMRGKIDSLDKGDVCSVNEHFIARIGTFHELDMPTHGKVEEIYNLSVKPGYAVVVSTLGLDLWLLTETGVVFMNKVKALTRLE